MGFRKIAMLHTGCVTVAPLKKLVHELYPEAEIKMCIRDRGYDEKSVSKLVSTALAKLVLQLIQASNQHRICIAGGDTSARIIEMLNIHASELVDEIQTGICSSLSLGEPKLLMILKSGSFGNEQFLIDAIDYLKQY